MRRTLLTIVLLTLLPDVYIWWRHLAGCAPLWLQIAWWLPFVTLLATIWEFLVRHRHRLLSLRLIFSYQLCITLPKICFSLASLIAGWPWGLVASGIFLLFVIYGFIWGPQQLKVRRESAAWSSLPKAFDGYRIVQISDIHAGSLGKHSRLVQRMVETVNAEHADLIVMTGDLVNQRVKELTPYIYMLSGLQCADGIYAVLGNHDFVARVDELSEDIKRMGWHLLRNRSVELHRGGQHITLIGVDIISNWAFVSHGNLAEAMAKVDHDSFQILLTHDPAHWRNDIVGATHIELTLSGHTHGGQLRIGRRSIAQRFARYWWRWYQEGEQRLYVSAGISCAFPFRLGAWPEVTVMTLRRG